MLICLWMTLCSTMVDRIKIQLPSVECWSQLSWAHRLDHAHLFPTVLLVTSQPSLRSTMTGVFILQFDKHSTEPIVNPLPGHHWLPLLFAQSSFNSQLHHYISHLWSMQKHTDGNSGWMTFLRWLSKENKCQHKHCLQTWFFHNMFYWWGNQNTKSL